MEYRVEDLAAAAGVSVDTVRFYQGRGLLPAPRREGRRAVYGEAHLRRLRRIRELQSDGVPLAMVGRLLEPGRRRGDAALRRAVGEARGGRVLSRAELAAGAGIPEQLVQAVEAAGLLSPLRVGDETRYGEADVELGKAALAVLREGFPLGELLGLAMTHSENVRDVADRAADLFDRHVRHGPDGAERDADEVVAAFQRLMPAVTALVANHFHRTVVAIAIARLEKRGETDALRHALDATASGRLEVVWR